MSYLHEKRKVSAHWKCYVFSDGIVCVLINVYHNIIEISKKNLSIPLGVSEMPIQDAIDLADFLVEISKKTSRFLPGPQIIGGPTDIAVITKHEGFKWIQKKHYYDYNLNIIDNERGE